ncbi:MAG: hypothetical protein AMJ90_05290 [candidate division Zixibacteria bacterium SM23_73_2]|nr:MAG: hypothetical protein AMJ90_05290 [candidate division Zixibacteria bacterium SM23_73_2]
MNNSKKYSTRQKIGLFLGIFLFVLMLFIPSPEGMSPSAQRMGAVVLLMATWWITEALPIAVTSLLPIPLYPLLGIMNSSEVTPNYTDHLVFLFLGGFIIALAIQKWELHKRIALHIIKFIGTSPQRLVLGFMCATAFLSMWISNTATTMLMLPIVMAVVVQLSEGREDENFIKLKFGLVMMLAIAYGANAGGVGTLIGTPPNVIFAGFVKKLFPEAPEVTFLQWMKIGIPVVLLFLPVAWFYLCNFASGVKLKNLNIVQAEDVIGEQIKKLGKMNSGEKWVLVIFTLTALLWIFRKPLDLGILEIPGWSSFLGEPKFISDATVAVFMALLLFLIPVKKEKAGKKKTSFLMDWHTAEKGVPWGVLLLFGGGFALASGMDTTGLSRWIAGKLQTFAGVPPILMIPLICLSFTFLSEITSNTAMSAMMMPVLASTAVGAGMHPFLLMIPATLSNSYAYMMPVGTPPNAIVFGSGWVTIPRMARAGFFMNLLGAVIITLVVYFIAVPVFGINFGEIPLWVK